ncbi:strawberry notch family protein [Shewanella sp. BF02_Schw]|uniref:strawberry notch-like NTP hydrolase domain-containing protein n=1 Tax=Shewanella sp. BF02_Schw TaxID=394908 RepID=UPI0017827728|nr:strawberry notch family protein [Shewanella sp. BF02_Schw]MBO1897696.1 strawberry notch family protein [Shewanella sp. BF02_Schw]
MSQNKKWLHFHEHNCYLVPTILPSKKPVLLMVGALADSRSIDGLAELGFKKVSDNTYYATKYSKSGGKIEGLDINAFKQYWPSLTVEEVPMDFVYRPWVLVKETLSSPSNKKTATLTKVNNKSTKTSPPPEPTVTLKSEAIRMQQATFLGRNYLDEKVYKDQDGRFSTNNDDVISAWSHGDDDGRYLFAIEAMRYNSTPKIESILQCAEGFVNDLIQSNQKVTFEDTLKVATVWFDISEPKLKERNDQGVPLIIAVQRSVETVIAARLASAKAGAKEFTHEDSLALVNKYTYLHAIKPTISNTKIQELTKNEHIAFTPESLPVISKVAGDFTRDLPEGSKVVVPFASVGGAIPFLEGHLKVELVGQKGEMGLSKFGFPSYLAKNINFTERDLHNGAIESKSADCMILNAPIGNMLASQNVDGVNLNRYDHKLAIELLRSIKDDGKALIFVNVDGGSYIGNVRNESKEFHDFLYQNYNVTSCIDFDPTIASAKRIYTIDGRKLAKSSNITIPYELKTLYTNEQLIEWVGIKDNFKYNEVDSIESIINNLSSKDIQVNEYQSEYNSLSKIGESSSKIPKNMTAAVRQGFTRFLATHDDIDEFVGKSLQMSQEQLARVFTPEQIDAIGLAIWRDENGLAFLIGDKTGEGKGRVNAAIIRYNILAGKEVIFMTSKATLFQDIWRDIVNIESESIIKPFLVNEKSNIVDSSGQIIAQANQQQTNNYVQQHKFPDDCNLLMVTYSQLSRATKYEKVAGTALPIRDKSSWLQSVSSGKFVNLDESHLASGNSNTNKRILKILNNASNVLYSSGTWARTEKNFGVYYRLLRNIEPEIIQQAVKKGGNVLLEIFSSSLASDGGFIRRESDISSITIEPKKNTADLNKNIALSDSFANVAQALAILSGGLSRVVNESNQKLADALKVNGKSPGSTKDIGLNTTSFGSLLSNLSKQFVLSLNSDFAANQAIESLKRNEKPFVALEFAGNSFYKMMYDEQKDLIANGKAPSDYLLSGPLQFRDIFKTALNRLTTVTDKKNGHKVPVQQLLEAQKLSNFNTLIKEIKIEIDKMPDLAFMPVDNIRHKVEAAGYSFAEVSGRNIRIDLRSDGLYQFVKFDKSSPLEVRNAFNNGDLDVLLGTKAMVDGVSIHSDVSFKDQRVRRLIEVEVFRNVTDRVQLLGRVNRRGQVTKPVVSTLSCGLPAQERLNAMSNYALIKMSANMTSNRDSSFSLDTINILNEEGDMVCHKYLEANPSLIHKLGLNPSDILIENITKSSIDSLSRKLTGRLILLPYLEQEKVYTEICNEYKSKIIELNNQGINPLKPTYMDIQAKEVSRQIYKGVQRNSYPSIFDEPVSIIEVEYQEMIKPWDAETVLDKMELAEESLKLDVRLKSDTLEGMADIVKAGLDGSLLGACDNDQALLDAIILDRNNRLFANSSGTQYVPLPWTPITDLVNKSIARSEYLTEILPKIKIGSIIELPNSFYSSFNLKGECVITNIKLPSPGSEHNPSQYSFKVITPGDTEEMTLNLGSFFNSRDKEFIKATVFDEFSQLATEFDTYQFGQVYRKSVMLEGNLFAAALEAADEGLGKPVTYTTEDGHEKRAILLKHDLTVKEMLHKPVYIHDHKTAADHLRDCKEGYICNTDKRSDDGAITIHISASRDSYSLMLPAGVRKVKPFLENEMFVSAINGRNHESTRSFNKLDIYENELDDAIKAMYKMGIKFKTKADGVSWINKYENHQLNIKTPLVNPKTHNQHAASLKTA